MVINFLRITLRNKGKSTRRRRKMRYTNAMRMPSPRMTNSLQTSTNGRPVKHSIVPGAMDKKEIVNEYAYVFDASQTIQFVMESSLPGATMTPAERLLQAQINEAEKQGSLFEFDVFKLFLL